MPFGGNVLPGGWTSTLYIGVPMRVVRRRRVEEADPLAADLVELAVVVRVPRQRLDPHQLAADEQVVVDRQLVPGLEADAGLGRVVVAEGDERLRRAAEHRPRHRLARPRRGPR